MVLPQDYQDKMRGLLGDDYGNYLESFAHSVGQSLRVNLLKTEPAELFRRLSAVDRPNEGKIADRNSQDESKVTDGNSPEDSKVTDGNSPEDSRALDRNRSDENSDGALSATGAELVGNSLFSPVPWCPCGAFYEGENRISLYPYYQAGLYYIQEPSAMAPASFLPVSPGDRVLDLCAAPGGKTTALGARLDGKGLLVANDISISRCKALLKNVQLAGLSNVMITCEEPEKLAQYFQGYFDAILVDAPCSGEGMFRRDPAMMKGWSLEEVHRYQQLQKRILSVAADMVKPGGHILYSTCTYSPEENEQVVETLLDSRQFELLPLPEYEGVDSGHPEWSLSGNHSLVNCRRFWNHRVRGEGQFAALLKKIEPISPLGGLSPADKAVTKESRIALEPDLRQSVGERSASKQLSKKQSSGKQSVGKQSAREKKKHMQGVAASGSGGEKNSLPEEFLSFMKHIRWSKTTGHAAMTVPGKVLKVKERLFLLPEDAPDLSRLRVVSSGLHLGNCKKNRFEPGQALALTLKADEFDNVLRLSPLDERVDRYLRCETLELYGQDDSSVADCSHINAFSHKNEESSLKEGWCLICIEEFPLGWGKVSQGRVKNKYPPGWRMT